jgi:FkbH-like protein
MTGAHGSSVTTPSFAQIEAELARVDMRGMPACRFVVLRNITVEPMAAYLRYFAYRAGLNAHVAFGAYDTVLQEALGTDLLDAQTDCILVHTALEQLSWRLARDFPALSKADVAAEIERVDAFVDAVCAALRDRTKAMILWHGLVTPAYPSLGILDSQSEDGQPAVIRELNRSLRGRLREAGDAFFVDTDACLARVGYSRFFDWRQWHLGRAPYAREALRELAFEDLKFVRARLGKNKKCIVLDCDNVLWGGVVGEDGLSGLRLGETHPGSAYGELQQELVSLSARGVLIALCSKNNPEDVWQVFREHPGMVLKERHIAAARINWNDKASSLRALARDLNLGLESMVFVDDSDFEVNLVRRELPEVEVIHLPPERPSEYRLILASSGLFDTLAVSQEDRRRGAMYQAEAERKRLEHTATDLEGYLRSLEMVAELDLADPAAIPRIAQQTQRTNQFNLTTRRYGEAEIAHLAAHDASDVVYLRLRDRFGDSGIVAACILRYREGDAVVDTFLVSCRALSRGVEAVLLVEVLRRARRKGCARVVGEFYATPKNAQVGDFYSRHGFIEGDAVASEADRVFVFDLGGVIPAPPGWFATIASTIA